MCKTIKQKVKFGAPPELVYELLADSKKQEAVTGSKANISNKVGGTFSAYDGSITGINVDLSPSKRIVLAWRDKNFPEGIFSMATFVLAPTKDGKTELTLTHRGVPKNLIPGIEKGWKEKYWDKMKAYILLVSFFLALFQCKSIDKKSTSDEIIDYAARKVARDILANYIDKEKKTIGVATFSKEELENKTANTLGLFLANSIHTEMFNPTRYDLVERTQIDKLVEEFKSYKNGLYSENDTKQLSLHGVDYLLIGSLQKRQDTIRINARLVSVQTGKIVSIASEAIPANNSISQLYESGNTTEKMDKEDTSSNSMFISRKTETGMKQATDFFLDDQIFLTYKQGRPFNTTRIELGFSECQRGIFNRKTFSLNSSWTGFGYPADSTMSLKDFLTDYNSVALPSSTCFDISFIVKDSTTQKISINIDKRKFKYNGFFSDSP